MEFTGGSLNSCFSGYQSLRPVVRIPPPMVSPSVTGSPLTPLSNRIPGVVLLRCVRIFRCRRIVGVEICTLMLSGFSRRISSAVIGDVFFSASQLDWSSVITLTKLVGTAGISGFLGVLISTVWNRFGGF